MSEIPCLHSIETTPPDPASEPVVARTGANETRSGFAVRVWSAGTR